MSACRPWAEPRPGIASAEPLQPRRRWPLAWAAAVPLAPWLLIQGRRVRQTTLRLPEPPGSRHGHWSISVPASASTTPLARPVLRVLMVGDSSMAGVGAGHQSEALSGALGLVLEDAPKHDDAPRLQVQWQLIARTGLRTREMVDLLAGPARPQGRDAVVPFDLALVALGVNDATALQSAAAFRRDVARLDRLLRMQQGVRRVLWSGLPPVHRFPALPQPLRGVLGRKAIELDAVLRELDQDYLPMPAQLESHWIAADGFHPGPPAYAAWARQMAPGLREACVALATA